MSTGELPHRYLTILAAKADVSTDWLIAELLDWHTPKQRVMSASLELLDEVAHERDQARERVEHLTEILRRVVKYGHAWLQANPDNERVRRRQVQAMVETAESALERTDA